MLKITIFSIAHLLSTSLIRRTSFRTADDRVGAHHFLRGPLSVSDNNLYGDVASASPAYYDVVLERLRGLNEKLHQV